jgi:hypothetical protein
MTYLIAIGGFTYVVAGKPRRVLDYPEAFVGWHFVIPIGAFMGVFAFVWG